MSIIFERLKAARKNLGLNQAQAAEKCGVTRDTWSRYERGLVSPGMEVLAAFAAAGADMQYILTGEHERDPSLLDLPSFERGLEVMDRVLTVLHELGVDPGKEGTKQICLYAHQYCPTNAGLKAYIESVFALSNTISQQPKNDTEEQPIDEDDDFNYLDALYLGPDK